MDSTNATAEQIVDIEEFGKRGEKPPRAHRYRIRVDKERYVVEVGEMTGAEILQLAGKIPPDRFRLDQKLRGGETKKTELDEVVDFTTPGVERFMTLPLDQNEG